MPHSTASKASAGSSSIATSRLFAGTTRATSRALTSPQMRCGTTPTSNWRTSSPRSSDAHASTSAKSSRPCSTNTSVLIHPASTPTSWVFRWHRCCGPSRPVNPRSAHSPGAPAPRPLPGASPPPWPQPPPCRRRRRRGSAGWHATEATPPGQCRTRVAWRRLSLVVGGVARRDHRIEQQNNNTSAAAPTVTVEAAAPQVNPTIPATPDPVCAEWANR